MFLPNEGDFTSPIYFVEVQFQPDTRFYQRFFSEIFLYLSRYERTIDWRAVVVFQRRSLDPGNLPQYVELLTSQRVRRIYLDELGEAADRSLGVGIVKLVVKTKKKAVNYAKQLFNRTRQEIADEATRQKVIQLIETIVLYKFPQLTTQEIEAMFGLSELKQPKVYQEAKQEGKLESVPKLLQFGLTIEQVAEALGLSVEQVRQAAAKSSEEK